jgi:hypothetical protein
MQWNRLVKHNNCVIEVDLVALKKLLQLVKPNCQLSQIICIKFNINYCAEFENLVFLIENCHFLQSDFIGMSLVFNIYFFYTFFEYFEFNFKVIYLYYLVFY